MKIATNFFCSFYIWGKYLHTLLQNIPHGTFLELRCLTPDKLMQRFKRFHMHIPVSFRSHPKPALSILSDIPSDVDARGWTPLQTHMNVLFTRIPGEPGSATGCSANVCTLGSVFTLKKCKVFLVILATLKDTTFNIQRTYFFPALQCWRLQLGKDWWMFSCEVSSDVSKNCNNSNSIQKTSTLDLCR